MELRKTFRFEASHRLARHPGKCSRLHGHSWVLHVFVEGVIDPVSGFVKDYAEISEIVKPLVNALDHRHLGDWEYINALGWGKDFWNPQIANWPTTIYPSSENLLIWFARVLTDKLDWSKLALEETCTSYAELTRREFDGWQYEKGT